MGSFELTPNPLPGVARPCTPILHGPEVARSPFFLKRQGARPATTGKFVFLFWEKEPCTPSTVLATRSYTRVAGMIVGSLSAFPSGRGKNPRPLGKAGYKGVPVSQYQRVLVPR